MSGPVLRRRTPSGTDVRMSTPWLFRLGAVFLGALAGVVVAVFSANMGTRAVEEWVEDETTRGLSGLSDDAPRVIVGDNGCYVAWAGEQVVTQARGPLTHVVATDEFGFRVAESEVGSRRESHVRVGDPCTVLAVGDSFTEGVWVEADEAWPAVVEAALAESGIGVDVLNGGFRGHGILEARIAVAGRWRALEPGVVVVAHSNNDLTDLVRGRCEPGTPVPAAFHREREQTLSAASRAVGMVRSRLASSFDRPPELDVAECGAALAAYGDEVEALASAVAEWGGSVVFYEVEAFWCPDGTEPDRQAVDALRERIGAVATYVDRPPDWRAEGGTLEPHDSHPSPRGHAVIGHHLAEAFPDALLAACR